MPLKRYLLLTVQHIMWKKISSSLDTTKSPTLCVSTPSPCPCSEEVDVDCSREATIETIDRISWVDTISIDFSWMLFRRWVTYLLRWICLAPGNESNSPAPKFSLHPHFYSQLGKLFYIQYSRSRNQPHKQCNPSWFFFPRNFKSKSMQGNTVMSHTLE